MNVINHLSDLRLFSLYVHNYDNEFIYFFKYSFNLSTISSCPSCTYLNRKCENKLKYQNM